MSILYDTEKEARNRAEVIAEKGFWLDNELYPAHVVTRCVVVPPDAIAEKVVETKLAWEGAGLA